MRLFKPDTRKLGANYEIDKLAKIAIKDKDHHIRLSAAIEIFTILINQPSDFYHDKLERSLIKIINESKDEIIKVRAIGTFYESDLFNKYSEKYDHIYSLIDSDFFKQFSSGEWPSEVVLSIKHIQAQYIAELASRFPDTRLHAASRLKNLGDGSWCEIIEGQPSDFVSLSNIDDSRILLPLLSQFMWGPLSRDLTVKDEETIDYISNQFNYYWDEYSPGRDIIKDVMKSLSREYVFGCVAKAIKSRNMVGYVEKEELKTAVTALGYFEWDNAQSILNHVAQGPCGSSTVKNIASDILNTKFSVSAPVSIKPVSIKPITYYSICLDKIDFMA